MRTLGYGAGIGRARLPPRRSAIRSRAKRIGRCCVLQCTSRLAHTGLRAPAKLDSDYSGAVVSCLVNFSHCMLFASHFGALSFLRLWCDRVHALIGACVRSNLRMIDLLTAIVVQDPHAIGDESWQKSLVGGWRDNSWRKGVVGTASRQG